MTVQNDGKMKGGDYNEFGCWSKQGQRNEFGDIRCDG